MTKPASIRIVLVAALFGCLQARGQTQTLVIEGGALIDGSGGAPVTDPVIVIEGPRIKAVGTKGKVSYPQNAKVISAAGKTILPGLIDSHIHLRDWMLPMFLRYGVTTIYDTNNHTDWILLQREALKTGKLKGPRLFTTGMAVTTPPGTANDTNFVVRTPEQARAFVRNMVSLGVDGIKTQETLTPELLQAVLDEAAKAGVPVVGHTDNIRWAAELGYTFMEHTETLAHAILEAESPERLREVKEKQIAYPESLMDMKLFDPLIQLMVRKGVYINPTFAAYWRFSNPRAKDWTRIAGEITKDAGLQFVPADVQQSWVSAPRNPPSFEGFKKVQEFTRKYVEAGGRIVAGSDSGYMPGLGMHFEMQSMVDAGVPPMKAILSATKWAAELFGKGKELGTIEAGKLADLTIVEGNPLQDITATQKVRLVIKDGQIVDTAYDPNFKNPVPRPTDVGPVLAALAPRTAREGGQSVTLQVTGERFHPKSVVRFDTTDLQTQFVSATKLTATLDRRLLQNMGTYAVSVVNPGSGGGASNVIYFLVNFKE